MEGSPVNERVNLAGNNEIQREVVQARGALEPRYEDVGAAEIDNR